MNTTESEARQRAVRELVALHLSGELTEEKWLRIADSCQPGPADGFVREALRRAVFRELETMPGHRE